MPRYAFTSRHHVQSAATIPIAAGPAGRPPARPPSWSSPCRCRPARLRSGRRRRSGGRAAGLRRRALVLHLVARSGRAPPGAPSCCRRGPSARTRFWLVERLHDGRLDVREAVLEVDGGDRRLEQRREHVAAPRDADRAPARERPAPARGGARRDRAPSPPRRSCGARRRAPGSSPGGPSEASGKRS